MKVVLFCGGLGTRLREYSDTIPKPLVPIGPRPILWHLMCHYAKFGHTDFILCLGFKGELIRDYFLNYNPYLDGEVVLEPSGRKFASPNVDPANWRITFVDTGLHANLGERLLAVRHHVEGDEFFMANYSDQLCNLDLSTFQDEFLASRATAGFISVKPPQSYHYVKSDADGYVEELESAQDSDNWINGGYFMLNQSVFDYIEPGDELVGPPFERLAVDRQLWTKRFSGFWRSMDNFKDKITFDRMWARCDVPWHVGV